MRNLYTILLISILIFNSKKSFTQIQNNDSIYTFKKGDYNGIGKWYMGREIAFVMGYQAIGWLERSEREQEENVAKLIENMKINSNDVIADIGAGSGYHSFKISSKSDKGLVYAVDIQPEMLLAIENRKELSAVINIFYKFKSSHIHFFYSLLFRHFMNRFNWNIWIFTPVLY